MQCNKYQISSSRIRLVPYCLFCYSLNIYINFILIYNTYRIGNSAPYQGHFPSYYSFLSSLYLDVTALPAMIHQCHFSQPSYISAMHLFRHAQPYLSPHQPLQPYPYPSSSRTTATQARVRAMVQDLPRIQPFLYGTRHEKRKKKERSSNANTTHLPLIRNYYDISLARNFLVLRLLVNLASLASTVILRLTAIISPQPWFEVPVPGARYRDDVLVDCIILS